MKFLVPLSLVVFVMVLVYWNHKTRIIQNEINVAGKGSSQWILYKSDFQVSDPFHLKSESVTKWLQVTQFTSTPELQEQIGKLVKLVRPSNPRWSEPKFALEFSDDHCLLFSFSDDIFLRFRFKKDGDEINLQEGFDILQNSELKKSMKEIILKNKM